MAEQDESDLFRAVLGPEDGGRGDIATIGTEAQLARVRDAAQASRVALGLPAFDRDLAHQMIAVSHGTDLDLDDAFINFLEAHPEVAAGSVRPAVFRRLIKLCSGLSAVEQGATPLGAWLLRAVAAFDQEHGRLNGEVLDLLDRPPLAEVVPGLTVRRARAILAIVLHTVEQRAQLDRGRRDRHRRQREQGQALRRPQRGAEKALPPAGAAGEKAVARTRNRSARPGGVPAARRQPPRADAEQLMKEALRLEGLQGLVGISGAEAAWTGRVPASAFASGPRAISLAIAIGLQAPLAGPLQAALGTDPARIRDNLARQARAWEAARELFAILSGVQDRRQAVDAARLLARGLVLTAGEEALATLGGDARARLEDGLQRLRGLQDANRADRSAQRALTARIAAQGRGTLADLRARQDLMTALDQLGRGGEPPWDLMVKAAETLDRLGGNPDVLPPEPPPGSDRRGGGRG